ncbi:MAG TPA: hypothetical protein VFY16_05385 [Gemmatimonadaceae bacterium]|nr:hypothetical protein [Gemmatimonadaceae bacterium]
MLLVARTILARHAPLLARGAVLALIALPFATSRASAQTDFYNTDAGRPITVEDAYPIERRALEIQLAPLRLERAAGGSYAWGLEPEVAVGLLPRTQLEIGFPLAHVDAGAGRSSTGLAGIEIAALHNLNVETAIPAFAIAGELRLPAGGLAPEKAYPSVKGIVTKTFTWARFHLNGQYTFGDRIVADADGASHGVGELSRWMSGVAVDRTIPLESMLLTAELVARQPLVDGTDVEWSTAAGTRYQLSPRVALDGGAGYRLTGDDEGWFVTFGAAVAVGLPWSPRR